MVMTAWFSNSCLLGFNKVTIKQHCMHSSMVASMETATTKNPAVQTRPEAVYINTVHTQQVITGLKKHTRITF